MVQHQSLLRILGLESFLLSTGHRFPGVLEMLLPCSEPETICTPYPVVIESGRGFFFLVFFLAFGFLDFTGTYPLGQESSLAPFSRSLV